MAILTDDEDKGQAHFWMRLGSNGDYYLNIRQENISVSNGSQFLHKATANTCVRIATSGGNTRKHTDVLVAMANLFRAMEAAGLNIEPNQKGDSS